MITANARIAESITVPIAADPQFPMAAGITMMIFTDRAIIGIIAAWTECRPMYAATGIQMSRVLLMTMQVNIRADSAGITGV